VGRREAWGWSLSTTAIRYRAFLSYSHHDESWCKWLHGALESYRVDRALVGRDTAAGPVPRSLRIFRDRSDFSAGSSLTAQTLAALDASQFLVVICSPSASKSKYVNEEVRHFKASGRADRIIPIIVDGDPSSREHDCFPPALKYNVGLDGTLTNEPSEPLGADARPQGDGKVVAVQKVVAGLLGIGLDEIIRRSQQAQLRHARRRNALIAVLIGLTLLSSAGFLWARHELQRNESLVERTLKRATGIVTKAVGLSKKFGAPIGATLSFLEEAEAILNDIIELGSQRPKVLATRASMLIQFGESYAILGQSETQRERVTDALNIFTKLASEQPSDLAFQYGKAQAQHALGKVEATQGRFGEALEHFLSAERTIISLAAIDQKYSSGELSLPELRTQIGDVLKAQGKIADSISAYVSAQVSLEESGPAAPDNYLRRYELATLRAKLGDAYLAQMNHARALIFFREALAILGELTTAEPSNHLWQSQLIVVHSRIGLILRFQKDLAGALAAFNAQLTAQQRLAAADPKNALFQSNLASAYHSVGEIFIDRMEFDSSLDAFRSSLAIRQRLASSDLKNVHWLAGLAATESQIGDVYRIKGLPNEAFKSFDAALKTSQRLVDQDPTVPAYKISLIVAHGLFADLLVSQDVARALLHLHESVAVSESLSRSYPSENSYQLVLSTSHLRLGNFHLDQNQFSEAIAAYERGISLAARSLGLTGAATDDEQVAKSGLYAPNLQDYLRVANDAYLLAIRISQALTQPESKHLEPGSTFWLEQIAYAFEKNSDRFAQVGYRVEALNVAFAALQIRERGAAGIPTSAIHRLLYQAHERVGDRRTDLRMWDGALTAYSAFLSMAEQRAKRDPSSVPAQRDYSIGFEKVGNALFELRKIEQALTAHRSAQEIRTLSSAANPNDAMLQRDLARSLIKVAEMTILSGSVSDGVAILHRVVAMCSEFSKRDSIELEDAAPCAMTFWRLGTLLGSAGLENLQRARGILAHFHRSTGLNEPLRVALRSIEDQINRLSGTLHPLWNTRRPLEYLSGPHSQGSP
jgi:tetratricopeptide (TPR) repeat protein